MNFRRLNLKLLIPLIIFFIISLLAISFSEATMSETLLNDNYPLKQLFFYIAGFILIFFIYRFNIDSIYRFINPIYWTLFVMLIILFLGFPDIFVVSAGGSDGWFYIPIINISFQPIEVMKIAIIFKLAMISKKHWLTGEKDREIIKKYAFYGGVPLFLILMQPDLGGVLVMGFSIYMMLLFSIKKYKLFLKISIGFLFLLILGLLTLIIFPEFLIKFTPLQEYQLGRIFEWLSPYESDAYQLNQSMLAMGSAGLFGHGPWYNGVVIPEAHTDFIFAIWAGATGFIGGAFLIGTYYIYVKEFFTIAEESNDVVHKLVLIGFGSLILIQVLENIGMTIGLLPITGIVLPYISYGGTALISFMVIAGIALNLSSLSKTKIFN